MGSERGKRKKRVGSREHNSEMWREREGKIGGKVEEETKWRRKQSERNLEGVKR